jgi:hypothetical protein
MDCSSQYDALISCEAGVDDICADNSNKCKTETEALTACALKYCSANPSASVCTGS